jgi:uncharacterized protein GlcG (DUF336 family)
MAEGENVFGWPEAQRLVEAVLRNADQRDLHVAVAIVDQTGELLGFQRDHDAFLTSSAVAIAKAFTAANFRMPVGTISKRLSSESKTEIGRSDGRVIFLEGGFPIQRRDLLGGIGVSGATAAQDAELAVAGLAEEGYETDFPED